VSDPVGLPGPAGGGPGAEGGACAEAPDEADGDEADGDEADGDAGAGGEEADGDAGAGGDAGPRGTPALSGPPLDGGGASSLRVKYPGALSRTAGKRPIGLHPEGVIVTVVSSAVVLSAQSHA
jgi:hypothetical protein